MIAGARKDTSNTDMETALIQAAVLFFVFAVMVLTGKVFLYFRNESHRASLLNSRCHELLTSFDHHANS